MHFTKQIDTNKPSHLRVFLSVMKSPIGRAVHSASISSGVNHLYVSQFPGSEIMNVGPVNLGVVSLWKYQWNIYVIWTPNVIDRLILLPFDI